MPSFCSEMMASQQALESFRKITALFRDGMLADVVMLVDGPAVAGSGTPTTERHLKSAQENHVSRPNADFDYPLGREHSNHVPKSAADFIALYAPREPIRS